MHERIAQRRLSVHKARSLAAHEEMQRDLVGLRAILNQMTLFASTERMRFLARYIDLVLSILSEVPADEFARYELRSDISIVLKHVADQFRILAKMPATEDPISGIAPGLPGLQIMLQPFDPAMSAVSGQ